MLNPTSPVLPQATPEKLVPSGETSHSATRLAFFNVLFPTKVDRNQDFLLSGPFRHHIANGSVRVA